MKNFGFSLIEILIATLLLSMMMLGVITISNNSISTKERIVSQDDKRLSIQSAISRIENDISQLYSPLYSFTKKKKQDDTQINENLNTTENDIPIPEFFNEDKNTIIFLSSSNRSFLQNPMQSNFIWIKYTLKKQELSDEERNDELGEYAIVRSTNANNPYTSDDKIESSAKEYEVLNYVESLTFEFWNSKTKKFFDKYTDLSNDDKERLRAIRVNIVWKGLPKQEAIKISFVARVLWPEFTPTPLIIPKKTNTALKDNTNFENTYTESQNDEDFINDEEF